MNIVSNYYLFYLYLVQKYIIMVNLHTNFNLNPLFEILYPANTHLFTLLYEALLRHRNILKQKI